MLEVLFSYVFNTKSMELLVPTADTQIHNKTKTFIPQTLVHVPHYSGHSATAHRHELNKQKDGFAFYLIPSIPTSLLSKISLSRPPQSSDIPIDLADLAVTRLLCCDWSFGMHIQRLSKYLSGVSSESLYVFKFKFKKSFLFSHKGFAESRST